MRHRTNTPPRRWKVIGIAAVLAVASTAGVYAYTDYAAEQRQLSAAERLMTESTQRAEVPEVATTPTVVPSQAPSMTPDATAPAPPSEAPVPPVSNDAPVLPIGQFHWPAASLSVDVVSMDWQVGQMIDPPVDADGFDRVGHWLRGTGENDRVKPIVLAAHTCTSSDRRLCNEVTFPFMKLSFNGWAAGQVASITDATGRTVNYTLIDRRIVPKAKDSIQFANNGCYLVVISCNVENPEGEITQVIFRRNECGA